jgi:hypothetical protein
MLIGNPAEIQTHSKLIQMKNNPVEITIKITLSILFLLCLFKMPYGYYQFTRFAGLVGFAFLSYNSYEENNKTFAFVFVTFAILFQPLFKISLGRPLWNILDVVVGAWLIASIFIKRKPL